MRGRCEVVTLADGSIVRVQGHLPTDELEALAAAVRAMEECRCESLSDVPMPQIAQQIHGRETYRCGRDAGHEGKHRWPREARRVIAEWENPS